MKHSQVWRNEKWHYEQIQLYEFKILEITGRFLDAPAFNFPAWLFSDPDESAAIACLFVTALETSEHLLWVIVISSF